MSQTLRLYLSHGPTQDTLHLLMAPQTPLCRDSSSDVPCFVTLTVLGITGEGLCGMSLRWDP